MKYDINYANSEEKFVKSVTLYGKNSDNYLYSDAKCTATNKVDGETVMNLFLKGMLVISYDSKGVFRPLAAKTESKGVSVNFMSVPSAGTMTTLYSAEHV